MMTDSLRMQGPIRRLVILLIIIAASVQAFRISTTRSATGETPFHSANDRSRWCTVASLGGQGTYEIDNFVNIRDPKTKRRTWYTIDMVRHRGSDGKQHYYSSKPPLLSTLHAAAYAAIRLTTGFSLVKQPFTSARLVIFAVNWFPLILFWVLWVRYWYRHGQRGWSFAILMLFLFFGTFTTTFANTLNNHLPGVLFAGIALWSVLKVLEEGNESLRYFATAGFCGAMTAACELPALSWCGLVGLLLFAYYPRKAILGFSLGALPVAAGFVATNLAAHGDLRPPYAHRDVGRLIATVPLSDMKTADSLDPQKIRAVLQKEHFNVSAVAVIGKTRTEGVQDLWDEDSQYRFALIATDKELKIHEWDDWYDYPGSYWYPDSKKGIDQGEPSIAMYTFHATIGHHGIISLTPFWLLVPVGLIAVCLRSNQATAPPLTTPSPADHVDAPRRRCMIAVAIMTATLVCFVFYMLRPLEDRNYGGVSCGFRWMFWFTPLWLWLCGFALSSIRSGWLRRLVELTLIASIFSATFPWSNPWTHPWIWQLAEKLGA